MFGFFTKKKKKLDKNEFVQRAKDDDKGAQYQLSLEYYRGTSLAQDKEKAEKISETNKHDV